MRRIAWVMMLLFVFAIPWEYSVDVEAPWGNIARIAGLLLLLAAVPAILQVGRLRPPGPLQWLVLAFFLWFCCSYFWTIAPLETLARLRAYFQVMMIVWLVWEFAESSSDLRALLRAFVAGSWVLAALTLANFASAHAIATGQLRFAPLGQDPNDVARFLDLGFPLAALLFNCESRRLVRALALGYLPVGLAAVLLTASRGGYIAAIVALAGCGILLIHGNPRRFLAGTLALPAVAAALWFTIPRETLERLATIPDQLQGGDLNQRLNIWTAGWHAFVRAPIFGTGAGSFVSAAGLAPSDTAHNTVLSLLVSGGLCALFLAVAIVAFSVWSILKTHGSLYVALATSLLVWAVTSLVASVEESRTTWFLLAVIALAERLALEEPEDLALCFSDSEAQNNLRKLRPLAT